jgi:hypothetical protein
MPRIPLVGGGFTARSVAEAAQTSINLYAEVIEDPNEHQKNSAVLYGVPGRHVFKDMTAIDARFTHIRGIWSGGGRCFVAGGNGSGATDGCYCEINSSGTLVGSVRSISNAAVNGMSNSPVQFFANGNQLMIVSGGLAYIDNGAGPVAVTQSAYSGTVDTFASGGVYWAIWDTGDKFDPGMVGQTITISGTPYTVSGYLNDSYIFLATSAGNQLAAAYTCSPTFGATTGFFQDTYYGITRPSSKQYNISAANDRTGNVWSGLDYGTKSSYPDHLQTVLSNNDLFLFGVESTDIHRNTGNASFPFESMQGANFRIGTPSAWAPISINGQVFFLGVNQVGRIIAYQMNGYQPIRISNHAIENQWSSANLGGNAVSCSQIYDGHSWWVINLGSQTWMYDVTSQVWTQRCDGSYATSWSALPMQFHTYVPEFGNGKHLVCGNSSGIVYEESLSFYDNDGADISWERTLPHFYADGKMQYFGRMTLEMETGGAPGTPNVYLDYSDDRGQTFHGSRPAMCLPASTGQYSVRVFWPSNGASRDRVFRLRGKGQNKVALIALDLDYTVGPA